MKTQMLRIIGCSNSSYWYAGKVGQVFRHMGFDLEAGEFITRASDGYINIIKAVDAEVVDVTPSAPTCAAPVADAPPLSYRVVLEIDFHDSSELERFDVNNLAQIAKADMVLFLKKMDLSTAVRLC